LPRKVDPLLSVCSAVDPGVSAAPAVATSLADRGPVTMEPAIVRTVQRPARRTPPPAARIVVQRRDELLDREPPPPPHTSWSADRLATLALADEEHERNRAARAAMSDAAARAWRRPVGDPVFELEPDQEELTDDHA
jgi:hypothetical protein